MTSQSLQPFRNKKHANFQHRQNYERMARAKFSQTIRKHMRDAEVYSKSKVWSCEEDALADKVLHIVRAHPDLDDELLVQAFLKTEPVLSVDTITTVWDRLTHQYPHMFEVAAARQQLSQLNLDGTHLGGSACGAIVSCVKYHGWSVPLQDLEALVGSDRMSPALVGLLFQFIQLRFENQLKGSTLVNPFYFLNLAKHAGKVRKALESSAKVWLPAWCQCFSLEPL